MQQLRWQCPSTNLTVFRHAAPDTHHPEAPTSVTICTRSSNTRHPLQGLFRRTCQCQAVQHSTCRLSQRTTIEGPWRIATQLPLLRHQLKPILCHTHIHTPGRIPAVMTLPPEVVTLPINSPPAAWHVVQSTCDRVISSWPCKL